jgi:hypothetical protein
VKSVKERASHQELTRLRDVVHQQRPHRPSVVRAGNRPVPLLAGGVPDLSLDGLAINLCASLPKS